MSDIGTPKRLREMEADETTLKSGRAYLDGVTLGVRRAKIDGYKLCVEAAQAVVNSDQSLEAEVAALRDALDSLELGEGEN